MDLHDPVNVLLVERMEHDRLVDPVQKLGEEPGLQRLLHRIANLLLAAPLLGDLLDRLAADVAGHHHDCVREVDRVAEAVGEPAIVEHLQEHVEHVAVGLLDLVEQNHRVGPTPHRLGQTSALLVAHIARRGADQSRDRVLLHELAHVDADHRVLVVEEHLGQCLAELRLAHARGPQENE